MQMGKLVMMENTYGEIFSYILADTTRHACFLNTLSLMELAGAKKLTRLLRYRSDNFLLEHLAEEYRHAYYLRKLASKLAGRELDFSKDNLLNARAANNYISHLDRLVCILIKEKELDKKYHYSYAAFLLCTYVIEQRALSFYKNYQLYLSNAGLSINVKSIISEEEKHLQFITQGLANDPALASLIAPTTAIEDKLFYAWFDGF